MNKKKILVLCTGNSCRSIMAEGLINHFGKNDFQAFSAGSKPTGYVHPMSIKTLKKSGILKSDYNHAIIFIYWPHNETKDDWLVAL